MSDNTQQDLPARQFGWWDMFLSQEDDPREYGPDTADERSLLVRYLGNYRLTLRMKCADLDAAALASRSVPPSNLSLLGLLRHLAGVEQYWFRCVLAGQDVPRLFRTADGSVAFDGAVPDPEVVAQAWQAWQAEVEFAEQLVADAPGLDVTGDYQVGPHRGAITVRQVLIHMIEEYARHCGHADFLRERIDGRVGQ